VLQWQAVVLGVASLPRVVRPPRAEPQARVYHSSEAAVFDSDRDEVWRGCGLRELRS
jgi:hypothetical protein